MTYPPKSYYSEPKERVLAVRCFKQGLIVLAVFVISLTGCQSQIYTQRGDDCLKYSVAKVHHLETGYMMTHEEVKALKVDLTQFKWVTGSDEIREALKTAPVILSLPLYTGNYEFIQHGIYRTNGNIYGHHAIVCVAEKDGVFEMVNSWGALWCIQGRCWINGKHLENVTGWQRKETK